MTRLILILAAIQADPVIRARVAPSGQGIAVEAFAADGTTPAPITGFGGLDENQSLTFSGTPKARSFTLAFGAARTAPIPFKRVPPSIAFLFNLTLPSPGTYDVQVNTPTARSSTVNIWSVYDGVLPVAGPVSFDLSKPPTAPIVDPKSKAVFRSLGRCAFATTEAVVESTAAIGVNRYVSAVRLVPASGGPAIVQVMSDPAITTYGPDRVFNLPNPRPAARTGLPGPYGAGYYEGETPCEYPAIRPTSWYADPAAVRAAIEALPGFAGGVTATSAFAVGQASGGPPTPLGPQVIDLAFGGPKARTAIGAPISSDPAVVPTLTHPGNQPIRYSINGGPPRPLPPGSITFNRSFAQSYFYAPLPQSDTYPGTVAGAYVATADGPTFYPTGQSLTGVGAGNATHTGVSTYLAYGISGSTLVWPLEGLPPATYKLEITWPAIKWPAHHPYAGSSKAAKVSVSDKTGAVLRSEALNQSVGPAGVADPSRRGVIWHPLGSFTVAGPENRLKVSLSNPGAGLTIADAVRLTRTSPDTSVKIAPADVVTLDAPAGAIITAAGPSPAIEGRVIPHAGGSLLPDPAPVKPAMPVGWNAGFEDNFGANLGHSDLLKRLVLPDGFSGVAASDAVGNPTALTAGSNGKATAMLAYRSPDGEANGPGAPVLLNDPAGVWSIWYDDLAGGTTPPPILCNGYGTPYPATGRPIAGRATGNRAYFHGVADPRATAPEVGVIVRGAARPNPDGTFPCPIRLRGVFPPDPTSGKVWTNPPTWHPIHAARLAIGPFRTVDLTGAAASNIAQFSDAASPSDLSFNATFTRSVPIGSIGDAPNPDGFFNPSVGATVQVTTTAPHGLNDMDGVILATAPGGTLGLPTYTMNGRPHAGYGPLDNLSTAVHVTGPSTFTFTTNFNRPLTPGVGNFAMTNTLKPAGASVVKWIKPATPYADIIALAAQSGSPPWLTIPSNASDDLINRVAKLCLALPKGTPIRVEYSNETWNSYVSERAKFEIWSYSMGLSKSAYDYGASYLVRMKHCQDLFAAAFRADGREADLIRVCGSQQGHLGVTSSLASYAAAHAIPADELSIAPYLEGAPLDATHGGIPPDLLDRFNTYTVPQNLDLIELLVEYGPLRDTFGQHRAAIDAAGWKRADGSPIRLTAYEGGFETVIPGLTIGHQAPTATNLGLRTQAVMRDPRMYRVARRILELAQLGGCSLWVEYRLGIKLGVITWDKVNGTYEPHGTGDPAKDLANVFPWRDKARLASQVAGAYRDWSAALPRPSRGAAKGRPNPPTTAVPARPEVPARANPTTRPR